MSARRLPVFPLNTVLFPGLALPLHIFEPRYRRMVADCLEGDRTFGVCLIRSGEEVGGPAEPYPVGTTCEIRRVTRLQDGRMLLETVGRERFRVLRLVREKEYLEAEVEPFPEQETDTPEALLQQVREQAEAYVSARLLLSGRSAEDVRLPEAALPLSRVVAAVLDLPLDRRQELLETTEAGARLRLELELLGSQLVELLPQLEQLSRTARPFEVRPDRINLN